MGRLSIRLMLTLVALLAAGTVARTTPWSSLGSDEAPRSSAETPLADVGSNAGEPTPAGSSLATDSAVPNLGEAAKPASETSAADRSETEAEAGDRITITRGEWEVFASAILETATLASAPTLAAAIPGRVLLGTLNTPLFATALPGDERIFVVERAGRIRILMPDGALRTFLDITGRVDDGGEGGLLGMAFPPDHAESGLFYVYYTAGSPFRSVLARYALRDGMPNVANPASQEILLNVSQPFGNHNGGTIAFSPTDGFLYVGLGDGGGGTDPNNVAPNGNPRLG